MLKLRDGYTLRPYACLDSWRVYEPECENWCVGFNAGNERVLIVGADGPRFVPCVDGDWQRAAHDAFVESGEESPWHAL
jgi:hypothetical protein